MDKPKISKGLTEKQCYVCKKSFRGDEVKKNFWKDKYRKDGWCGYCKECVNGNAEYNSKKKVRIDPTKE